MVAAAERAAAGGCEEGGAAGRRAGSAGGPGGPRHLPGLRAVHHAAPALELPGRDHRAVWLGGAPGHALCRWLGPASERMLQALTTWQA